MSSIKIVLILKPRLKMDKREFRTKAHQSVEKLIGEIEKLEDKKDKLTNDFKEKYEKQSASLRERKKELQEYLNKMEADQEENWEEKKEIFSKSLDHYKAGFAELAKLFGSEKAKGSSDRS